MTGGAISRAEHEARRRTPPTPIAEQFPVPVQAVDLVVCPCPIDTGGDEEDWLTEHHDALLTRLGARPSALACVGYSAGAGYATWLGVLAGRQL